MLSDLDAEHEADRIDALHAYGLIESDTTPDLDDFTLLASLVSGASMSAISLVDKDAQHFKSGFGVSARSAPRKNSLCALAIQDHVLFAIEDTATDPRLVEGTDWLLDGHQVRFYAGWPLLDSDGFSLGTLCVMDTQPKVLTDQQKAGLAALGRRVMAQMELRLQLKNTRRESRTDALTGVSNRRAFDQRMNEVWNRLGSQKRSMGMIVFDVDHFKAYNDDFGHKLGDTVLTQVAASVTSVLRLSDFFARYGGEEFAMILENVTEESATRVAEKIRRTIENFPWTCRAITVSVGVCVMNPSEDQNVNDMVTRADLAMYQAKAAGRNRVVFWKAQGGEK